MRLFNGIIGNGDPQDNLREEITPDRFKKMTLKVQNEHIYRAIVWMNRNGSWWSKRNIKFNRLLIMAVLVILILTGTLDVESLKMLVKALSNVCGM